MRTRPVLDTMDTDALSRRLEGTGLMSNIDMGPLTKNLWLVVLHHQWQVRR